MKHMRYCRSITAFALLAAVVLLPKFVAAQNVASAQGLYAVEEVRLENGFRVIMKRRPMTSNAAFRLVVGLGTRHFDCSLRETPHLLEHLLFSGTSLHTETELERLIEDRGGSWKAVTGTEQTIYQLDIFDQYALSGLDTLHEIVTDLVLTPEKLDRAKGIVYREEGGKPGAFRRLLYHFGVSKSAGKKAKAWLLPGSGAVCPGLVDMEAITEQGIAEAFLKAYVPENMTLIAIGNFDRKKLLDRINATFGGIPAAPKPELSVVTPPEPERGPAEVSSTLSPFLGSSGSFGVAYRTAGREHPDAAALVVLSNYVNAKFYERARIDAGLSYAPRAEMFFQPDYGIFSAAADISVKNLGRVRELMAEIFETLKSEKVAPEEAERTKRKILFRLAQGYETNAGLASLYSERLFSVDSKSEFPAGKRRVSLHRYERGIESVSAEDLDRVIELYIRPERRVDILSVPTVSFSAFFLFAIGIPLVIAIAAGYRLRVAAKRRRSASPVYLRKS
jgi:predicted Zn-dependent peptidase